MAADFRGWLLCHPNRTKVDLDLRPLYGIPTLNILHLLSRELFHPGIYHPNFYARVSGDPDSLRCLPGKAAALAAPGGRPTC